MQKKEFYYKSADGETEIHACMWQPEREPVGVIQIAHGVTEYILRYSELAEFFVERGCIRRAEEFLCTPEFEVKKDGTYQKVAENFLNVFEKAGYDFVRYSEIDLKGVSRDMADDILNILLTEGKVVRVTEEMYTLAEYMEQAKEKIKAHLAADPLITIAQVRDMFGTSRKSAKPILEYMDALKITKKMGAESERVAY